MSEDDKEKTAVGALYYSVDKLSEGGKALLDLMGNAGSRIYDDISPAVSTLAESVAKRSATKTEIENYQQKKAAGMRLIDEAVIADQNVNKITALAAESIPKDVPKENIKKPHDDWMVSWKEGAGKVSDEQMQSLWAGILAGKAQNQGSFSGKTLSIVQDMDKNLAESFIALCHFVVDMPLENDVDSIIYNENEAIYKNRNIDFSLINDLQSLGLLIRYPDISNVSHTPADPNNPIELFSYWGEHVVTTLQYEESHQKYVMSVGQIFLTTAGKDLFSIVRKTHEVKDIVFWQYLIKKWEEMDLHPREVSLEEANSILTSQGKPPIK